MTKRELEMLANALFSVRPDSIDASGAAQWLRCVHAIENALALNYSANFDDQLFDYICHTGAKAL